MDEYFSPMIHRIQQAIKQRAVHPESLVPELPDAIARLTRQPENLQEQSRDILQKLVQKADIKKGRSFVN